MMADGIEDGSRTETRRQRKTVVGRVVSDRMEKTVVVAVERMIAHPAYGRRVRRTKRLKAHVEGGGVAVGDLVELMETRRLSKDKSWRVARVLERARRA